MNRKTLKSLAKTSFKKHYFQYVLVCIITAFIATGIHNSLGILTACKGTYDSITEDEQVQDNNDDDNITTGIEHITFLNILSKFENNNAENIVSETDNQIKQEETKKEGILGRSNGVLAGLVNFVSTGAIYVTIINGVMSVAGSSDIVIALLTCIGIIAAFLWWFLFKDIVEVIKARIFLEGRTYDKVPTNKYLFIYRTGCWLKVSMTMCLKYVFQILWSLTIIGAPIKYYSYSMVPYIIAENPDMKARDAITLSRKIMNHHKFELFKLDLSFIGWDILNSLTLGLLGIFYINPYRTAVYIEYYARLRQLAKESNIPGAEFLNDTYLYEKADPELIQQAYSDVAEELKQPVPECTKPGGFKGFMANVFGLVLVTDKDYEKYAKAEVRQLRITSLKNIYNGIAYPVRLSPISHNEKKYKAKSTVLYYSRCYTIWSVILMFFVFSFIGWSWEVLLHLISDGRFVNRGMLHGPWLPIYGFGGVLILVLLNKFRKRPVVEFIAAIVLCGVVEYFTAYVMEVLHNGTKWWDYSGYFLNLHGRICAEGLLVFGLGGMAIVYIIAPLMDNIIRKLPLKPVIALCIVLLIIYFADTIYSGKHPNMGKGITNVAYDINYTNTLASNDNESLINTSDINYFTQLYF